MFIYHYFRVVNMLSEMDKQLYDIKFNFLEKIGKIPDRVWKNIKEKSKTARGSFGLGAYSGALLGAAAGGAYYASAVPYISNVAGALGLVGSMGLICTLGFGLFGLGALGIYYTLKRYGKKQATPEVAK